MNLLNKDKVFIEYPGLEHPYERNSLFVTGCARSENIPYATQSFTKLCPTSLYIHSVQPFISNRKPYCRWKVQYRHVSEHFAHATSKSLANNICTPMDAGILKKNFLVGPPSITEIIYATRCDCKYKDVKCVVQPGNGWMNVKQEVDCDEPQNFSYSNAPTAINCMYDEVNNTIIKKEVFDPSFENIQVKIERNDDYSDNTNGFDAEYGTTSMQIYNGSGSSANFREGGYIIKTEIVDDFDIKPKQKYCDICLQSIASYFAKKKKNVYL